MKINDKKAIREKTIADLRKSADALRKEFVVAKMQLKVGKLPNPKLLTALKHKLAVTLTVITEKEKSTV